MTSTAKAPSTPVSAFDLFKIGIGPSSSHTVGPMIAARQFACLLQSRGLLPQVAALVTQLYGSLSATGRGHGTDRAVLLGLAGHRPDRIDPDTIEPAIAAIRRERRLHLLGTHAVAFDEKEHLLFLRKSLPRHPNGLRFIALDAQGQALVEADYFSVGGGFVVDAQGESVRNEAGVQRPAPAALPFAFDTGAELLAQCRAQGLSIAALMMANETQWRPQAEVRSELLQVWDAMAGAVRRTCMRPGRVPVLAQPRRTAPAIASHTCSNSDRTSTCGRHCASLAIISAAIDRPCARHCASSSAPVSKAKGKAAGAGRCTPASLRTLSPCASTTKPPPTEK